MKRWKLSCAGACAAVLAANAWHLRTPRPPTWDDAWYLELSFRLFHALRKGLWPACEVFIHAFRIKAPLIILAPLPLYAAFGAREAVGPWANQPLLVLTWYAVYRIGRKLYSEKAGWAAAAACALTPLLYGLSRLFFVETLLTALATCSVWAIVEARPRDGRETARGLCLGLGLLAKSIFPLYVAGPAWMRRDALRAGWRRSLAVGAAVAASWYAFNLVYVAGFAASAAFGRIGHDYGAFSLASFENFFRVLLFDAVSWPYAAALAALFGLAALARRRAFSASDLFLASWPLIPLAAILISVNKDVRFIAPALPALAVAAGAAAASLPPRAAPLLLLLLAAPLAALYSQTLRPLPAIGTFIYNGASAPDGWDRAALVDAVSRRCAAGAVVAVALEHPLLNANNLASLAASRGLDFRFINLGYGQASAEGALIRLKDKGAGALVLVDGIADGQAPAFLNRADEGIRRMIKGGRLRAAPLEDVAVAPGVTARLYAIKP